MMSSNDAGYCRSAKNHGPPTKLSGAVITMTLAHADGIWSGISWRQRRWFADCELAWTNLNQAVRKIDLLWNGMIRAEKHIERVHPTQKPVGVMQFCLDQLPSDVHTIFDPFMGSGTTGVACVQSGKAFGRN